LVAVEKMKFYITTEHFLDGLKNQVLENMVLKNPFGLSIKSQLIE